MNLNDDTLKMSFPGTDCFFFFFLTHKETPIEDRQKNINTLECNDSNGELKGLSADLFCFVLCFLVRGISHLEKKPFIEGLAFQTVCCTWNYFDNSEKIKVSTNGS